jgi:hypothetical protein
METNDPNLVPKVCLRYLVFRAPSDHGQLSSVELTTAEYKHRLVTDTDR